MSIAKFESIIENIALGDNVLVYKWMLIEVYKMSTEEVRKGILRVIKESFV